MLDLLSRSRRPLLVAGALLLMAGCDSGGEATNAADAEALDANLLLEQPSNDASALESAVSAPEPVVTETGNQATNSTGVVGETSGGDTGGNTHSNVSAM